MAYFNALTLYYAGRWSADRGIPMAPRVAEVLTFLLFTSTIPTEARIGPGGMCEHRGAGVVIHPDARIGRNVRVFPQVTIGGAGGGKPGVPSVGDNVVLGTGAKILGAVTIGDNVTVGANAVVLQDVPAGMTAVGVPARIIPSVDARPE
jgi:serine O-acetyltransferase